jgi:hypothetical protein
MPIQRLSLVFSTYQKILDIFKLDDKVFYICAIVVLSLTSEHG